MIDPTNLEQELKKFVDELQEEAEEILAEDSIEALKESLKSSQAQASAQMINQVFKSHDMDVVVEPPTKAAESLTMSGKDGSIEMTEGEDQWFRADKLYGDDILGQLGFKYTDET